MPASQKAASIVSPNSSSNHIGQSGNSSQGAQKGNQSSGNSSNSGIVGRLGGGIAKTVGGLFVFGEKN
jgi:hypothetical protein